MDSVGPMNLYNLIKRRKGITPLMIGIIVAASVISLVFIVMVAVIPIMNYNLELNIRSGSIRDLSTSNDKGLRMNIFADYDAGQLYEVRILKNVDGTYLDYAYRDDITINFQEREEITVELSFFIAVSSNVEDPGTEIDNFNLVFISGSAYAVILKYRSLDFDYYDTNTVYFTFTPRS